MTKYINPYTDFGFKKLFGEEASKELLIDFLNELLPSNHKIVSLSFQNPEALAKTETERKAIFDIYCKTVTGQFIIVEMQKAKLKFFKDRAIFYTTFPIQAQAQKGEWDFELKPVYCVAILDFEFEKKGDDYISYVDLKDQYCRRFFDKLSYIFIEMPRFNKEAEELVTHFEKWLYFLKNLADMKNIPNILKEPIFEKGFHLAELAKYSPKENEEYMKSLLDYFTIKGVVITSFEEGEQSGIKKGEKIGIEKGERLKAENIVLIMHKDGESLEKIAKYTELAIDEIKRIIESST